MKQVNAAGFTRRAFVCSSAAWAVGSLAGCRMVLPAALVLYASSAFGATKPECGHMRTEENSPVVRHLSYETDFVVCGGGLAGVCAAVSAASQPRAPRRRASATNDAAASGIFIVQFSLAAATASRRSDSSRPRIAMISPGPPGVTMQPETAIRTGHITVPSLQPMLSA